MATNQDLKKLAFELFVNHNLPGEEIAEVVGKSPSQISRWKKQDADRGINWDLLQQRNNVSPANLRANALAVCDMIYKEAQEAKRPLNAKESDIIMKQTAAIKNLEKELNAGTAMMVLKAFNSHLVRTGKIEEAKILAGQQHDLVLTLMADE